LVGRPSRYLAVAERIRARGDEVVVLGSERGLERRLVPQAGFELVTLPSRQIMGQSGGARLRALPAMAAAGAAAWRVLGRRSSQIVVSVGGYASVPAVAAATARRLPVTLVEPNAVPGRANRAAARFAKRIFVQFDAAAEVFAQLRGAGRVRVAGIPLRTSLVEAFAGTASRRAPEPPYRLLVFGGSQGARQINEAMIEAAPALDRTQLEIFHQSGEVDRERVARAYAGAELRAEVVAFEPDMPARYAWADLALCRAGALTVAELALAGLPALLIPYPYAADDHQLANARALADAGAARVLDARPLPTRDLTLALRAALADPMELAAMGRKAGSLARPDAAERIVEECAALLGDAEAH
jgi:UDP-N-acetylglucosamine--N-acetylmuramyl-(pentapeptide) pyrophosphoryl-undecaprenol N-acetylglucosamine transferase